jgi:hypothetical protein
MITYRIQIETHAAIFFLKKEYLTYPQALKARRMMNLAKYGNCISKVYKFTNEIRGEMLHLQVHQS